MVPESDFDSETVELRDLPEGQVDEDDCPTASHPGHASDSILSVLRRHNRVSSKPEEMPSETVVLRALGKRIRELRKGRGDSQERLAELADIHENHLRRIEGGTANPSYLVLVRIARAFGLSVSELLRGL